MTIFNIKPTICFNRGSIEYLKNIKNKRVCIVTDPFMLKSGTADKIIDILKDNKVEYEIFSEIKPDPPIEIVAMGVNKMRIFKPDVVIALGGGSSIDATKSIIFFTIKILNTNGGNYKKPLFVAIPTTSGTGSEVTSFSVITMGGTKFPLINDELVPDIAIIDANLVKTVPQRITADTGMDVLTHAIEAYVSTKSSDYTDALAEKVVKLVFDYLLRAYRDGNDVLAREKLHNASCMAGMAFTNASLGINHSMAHTLGGKFHIPHGRANAILLPYVIEYNANLKSENETESGKKYANLSRILGLPCASTNEGVRSIIAAIKILMNATNTPMNLQEVNIDKLDFLNELENMVNDALNDKCTATNPRKTSKEEIAKLFEEVYGK
ncbi:1-propanol dehydrogenase PduQ [Clostridium autoethanogenum]|uniref:Iron-containing alcohol dehydrogenase n=2 Tax=Clostridium autoethanogenum TaxID=84023 RepID=A0A3M0SSQ1_9CLOT|nr:1-propanol dehydrogenase PduQ [Clostridium autoethanogenum]AGY77482.1 iron-containing alcohol dehydrogenase [Clostridium autoethanogenum DSM 10061]ALU37623.1 Alcohol dehydrogenase [Clostridium autoethanogenum DSM 10061]OVY49270.1 Aldehyde-alcohol dehydrogenase [Clostridium autoethanogenum]RMD00952.1 iron-containing alcohol dehydrogenase [Clostridium autoethanogenum]